MPGRGGKPPGGGEPPRGPEPGARVPRKRHRILRAIGLGLGGLVALLILILLGGYLWLISRSGEAFLRKQVVERTDAAIEGRLEIDRVALSGLLTLELDGVRLFAPGEARPVASIERVRTRVKLVALVTMRVDIPLFEVIRPRARIVQEGATTNLSRALARRTPPPPKATTKSNPPSISLSAPDIRLRDGAFEVEGTRTIAADNINLQGSLRGRIDDLTASVRLAARASEPVRRSATLDLVAHYGGTDAQIELLDLQTGQSSVRLTGGGRLDGSAAHLELYEALLAASDLNEVLPKLQLLGNLQLAGKLSLRGQDANADLQATLPKGRVNLDATAHLGPLIRRFADLRYAAAVDLDGVDLHRLVESMPIGLLQAHLQLEGRGLPPQEHATLRLVASGSRYDRLPVDRLVLAADLHGMDAEIHQLSASAANVSLEAHGLVGAKRANLDLRLDAPSLEETHTLLARGLTRPIPQLAGEAHLAATINGPYKSPEVMAQLNVPSLVFGAQHVAGLQGNVQLKSLRPAPNGSVNLAVSQLSVNGKTGENLRLNGAIDNRRVSLAASGQFENKPVRLIVQGERESFFKGEQRWSVDTIQVHALGVALESMQRAAVTFGRGRYAIEGLALNGGPLGRLRVQGSGESSGPLNAEVSLTHLDLARLPKVPALSRLAVRGIVNLDATVHGTAKVPIADVELAVGGGWYKDFGPVSFNSQVHYRAKRLEAFLRTDLKHGSIEVTGNVPLSSLKTALLAKGPPVPLQAIVSIEDVQLSDLQPLMTKPQPIGGMLVGTVRLGGTVQKPSLTTDLMLNHFAGFGADDVTVALNESYERDKLQVRLDVTRPEAINLSLAGASTVPLASVLRSKTFDWSQVPVDAQLDLKTLDLAWLRNMGRGPPDLSGHVAGRIALSGTAAAPRLDGTILAGAVNGGGYRNLEAILDVKAVDTIQLNLQAALGGQPAGEIVAQANDSLAHLVRMTPSERFAVPFEFKAKLLPTSLDRLLPPSPKVTSNRPTYQGEAALTLVALGTADRPTVHFVAGLRDLQLQNGKAVGALVANFDYEQGTTALRVNLDTPGSGSLHVGGTMTGPLGASILNSPSHPVLDYPITDFSIEAHQLDLAILNGVTEAVDDLGGTLDLAIAPQNGAMTLRHWGESLSGQVSIEGGKLTVVEFGSFSNITLKAQGSGTQRRFVVSRLDGRSGDGGFSVPAVVAGNPGIYFEVNRAGDTITGSLALDLKKFPVVQGYQTRAVISLRARTLAGPAPGEQQAAAPITISLPDRSMTISRLVLSHGEVQVPGSLPKNVQSLSGNPDVVIVNEKHQPRAAKGSAWKFAMNTIEIPQTECGANDPRTDCGPLIINAPLGNQVVLSTNPAQPLSFAFNPSLASRGINPVEVNGVIQVDGTVSLVKSRFHMDRLSSGSHSHVDFSGQPIADPRLDLQAHLESQTQQLVVNVTGTARNPQLKFNADPPFADKNEVYYFLATGERQTRAQQYDPTSVQTQLVNAGLSAIGSAAFGFVQNTLQSFLPPEARLDVLEIAPDVSTGGVGIGGIRAGKRYLNGKLFISGQYNPNANPYLNQNTYELRANYRIGGDKYVQGLAGTAGHYELKFFIQKDFCSPRQSRAGLCSHCSDTDALAGKCCTLTERMAGNCRCTAEAQQAGECILRQCFTNVLPPEQCVCKPEQQEAGLCALRPQGASK